MRESSQSTTVAAPPELVWDFLADYENFLHLVSGSAQARLIEGTPMTVGATYHASLSWEGLVAYWDARLVASDRPNFLRWESGSHGGMCDASVRLEAVEEQSTRLVMTVHYSAASGQGPLEPFAWGLLSRYFDRCVKRLPTVDWQH